MVANRSVERAVLVLALLVAAVAPRLWAQNGKGEPIFNAGQLFERCNQPVADRDVCIAYLRGFSDGNRFLIHDAHDPASLSVCIPNREPIHNAADLLVARFKGREAELKQLSPYRAMSIALSSRYACDKLFSR